MYRFLSLQNLRIESIVLLSNHHDVDILRPNMNARFAHNHHHSHHTSLEDRAIPLCIPVLKH